MKKYLLTFLTLGLLLCEASFTGGMAFAATTFDNGNYTYTILNETDASIKLKSGASPTSIVIPATIYYTAESKSYKVTTVAASGFSGCSTAKTLSIGSNITTIGGQAFKGCGFNATVTIPANVTSIGYDAFWNCTSLKTVNFNAASPLTSIGTYLFEGCSSLTSVTLPPLLTALPGNTFKGCTSLTTVTIPASVTSVANTAFNGCTALTTIHAKPDAAPTVSSAWSGITPGNITLQLYSSAANTSYSGNDKWSGFNISTIKSGSCGTSATWELNFLTNTLTISGSGAINDYTGTTLPWGADSAYIYTASVSNDITRLGNRTFYECKRLTHVSISNSKLTSIGQYAFYNCKRLEGFGNSTTQINIPKSVVTIEDYAFKNCTAATKVYMMSNAELTTIGTESFMQMTGMTDFAIYNATNLTTIGQRVVKGCSSLSSVTLPASVTSIGSDAFASCTALGAEDGFANFKGTLDQWAQISFGSSDANPAYVAKKLKINGTLVTECSLNVPVNGYAFRNNLAITSLTLGSGCTSVGNYAFGGCANLTGTLTIPSTLTAIGSNAFNKCTGFTAIDLMGATGLTTIQSGAFDGMTGVTGVLYIPSSVTSVGTMALRNMTGLSKIFANPTTAPSGTNSSSFTNITSKPLYVLTAAAYTSYTTTANWSDFTNIMYGGYCGAETDGVNMTWELNPNTGLLTISGSGAMKDYANSTSNRSPWYSFASSVTSIKICDGVTHVGKFAFHTCSNATEVWMSTTVTECGNSAFLGCSSLNNVKYGKTNTTVLSYATDWAQITFGNYQANPLSFAHTLQVYKPTSTMPAWGTVIAFENRNIDQIKQYAFYGCTSLTSAVLPSNVESIGESAFYGCTNLATVTLPDALTTIGKEAFKNCSTLTSITIPENVTTMTCHSGSTTYSIFGGCANLTTVVWNARNCANDYIKVGTGSGFNYGTPFSGIYSQITSITFGENVERIPNYLCYHMDHLTSVTIPASVTNIGTEAFDACSSTMSVTCEGTTPPTLASGAFSSPSTKKLYLPHNIAAKAAYRAASGWSSFTEANTFPKIVQFDMQEQGSSIDPQFFDNTTSKATEPSPAPTATGYSFGGWYQEEGCENAFNFGSTNITADKTLYAKWTINQYTISFDSNGGSAVASITQDYNTAVTAPADPTREGYTFNGWIPAVPSTMPASDTECVAQWTINSYDVTFNLQGHGTAIAAQSVDYNGTASQPADPEADYFTFGGWFDNEGCTGSPFDFSTPITADLTLYALWTENVFSFADTDTDNSKILAANGKLALSVTIGRTVWKDGYYNSMCLPFSLDAEQLAASPLAGYKALKRLSDATITGEDENRELNIQLEPITEITAGEPFFISYEVGENITNPVFENVTVTASAPGIISEGDVTCRGLYASTDLGTATTNLFLGANNTLYWPASGQSTIKGLRAYFAINPDSPAKAGMRVRLSDRPAEVPTALEETNHDPQIPIHKYIRDGVLFIERDGKTYNAQGVLVQ